MMKSQKRVKINHKVLEPSNEVSERWHMLSQVDTIVDAETRRFMDANS